MTGIFKSNNPYNNFLLFVYAFLLKFPIFLHPGIPLPRQPDGFFYRMLLKWLNPVGSVFPVIYAIIAFALIFTQAISLNKIVTSHRLLNKTSYLTGMTYILMTSLFTEWFQFSSPLIINTLLIWVLGQLCRLHNSPRPKTILFNIGMVTGLASFFYFPSIAFSLLIIVGLLITRPFILPEWILCLIGILCPYYFMFSWLYLTERLKDYKLPEFGVTIPQLRGDTWGYIALIIVFLLLMAGIYFIQSNIRKQLVQARKSWGLTFLYLLVSLFVPFLNETDNFEYWILAAVPVSVISSAAFLYPERKWFPTLMHWAMVALIIITGYFI